MNRLKELRREKKLTQKELADKLYTTKMSVSRWENGESQIKPEKAQALADLFGVSVGYLLGYENSDVIFWEALDKYGVEPQSEKEYLLELSEIESGREIFLKYFDKDTIKNIIENEHKVLKTLKLGREDALNSVNHFFRALNYLSQLETELLVYFKVLHIADKEIVLDLIKKLASRNTDN
uniref:helix-turn-helix domain-containing protein n=1 Tax=Streptococcus pluranimalium TaxID=82348 RepID=UPI003F691668